MTKLDFYYWGDQCPHNLRMRRILETFSRDSRCIINTCDISQEPGIAEELKLFSPNMLVINNITRWHGPVSTRSIERILDGDIPIAKPYFIKASNNEIRGEINDLTEDSILDTCLLCASSEERSQCSGKARWVESVRKSFNLPSLGKLHYDNDICIGGAEFVPSTIVPYPIPKAEDYAFLTCCYTTREDRDYKSYPLHELEKFLETLGYNTIFAIASEMTPFPNGPLEWFLTKGYMDLGMVYYEERHFAKMHLIKKVLK